METWYIPQILRSIESYYDNYSTLLHCLSGINVQIRNIDLRDALVLGDFQQILENLGFLDILIAVVGQLNAVDAGGSERQDGDRGAGGGRRVD